MNKGPFLTHFLHSAVIRVHTTTQGSKLKEVYRVEVIDSCSKAGPVMSYYLQNFPYFSLGVTHATSVQISLVTTSHMALPDYKEARNCSPLKKHQRAVIRVIYITVLS